MLKGTIIDEIEDQCVLNLTRKIGNNLQFYRVNESFGIHTLKNSLGYFMARSPIHAYLQGGSEAVDKLDVDLIIIDHLQYFTLTNPKNELQEMTEILKTVKEITDLHQIPVILVSHLRKKDKDRGLPGQEDFYGTSNIAKIASQAITITPSFNEQDALTHRYPTFFRFAKSRTGLKPNYAVMAHFNAKIGQYEPGYEIFKLKGSFPEDSPLERHLWPNWARSSSALKAENVTWEEDDG